MTTESRQDARRTGVRTLVRASAAALVAGSLAALAGLLADGTAGLLAGALGTAAVVAVLFTGALVVTVVADLMPTASLMVALMTYTLQMVLLAVVLIPLSTTDWAAAHLVGTWLAVAVIAAALAWTFAQVWAAVHARIPVYDLPPADVVREPRARVSPGAEGSAR